MTDMQECADLAALQQLAARYWARADGDLSVPLCGIFTTDAVVMLGTLELQGLRGIERFFLERDVTQRERLRAVAGDAGCHSCHTQGSCTERCPKHIEPTAAIAGLKRLAARAAIRGEL